MKQKISNYAFIDGQNLHIGIMDFGWKLDYKRFRVYLKEKYQVSKAYMFMGYLPANQELYNFLQSVGYVLIFKPVLQLESGKVKGNCDAELVLQAMIDYISYKKAVIVSGDGDFYCLVKYLESQNKLKMVLAPSSKNCSSLIKLVSKGKLSYITDLKSKLKYKRSPS
ncbi:MAG: NYN domain-containing protein [Planctomycetes bacterium]|nr:NYN domain-containing protein [Planctomycetota bacterium]